MQLTTRLPIATLFFKHWHTDDTEVGVVVAKATFQRAPDGRFRAVQTAPEFAMVDVFADGADAATAPLVQEQDIAPAKAATDLTIRAVARAPEAEPIGSWPVQVTVADRLTYGFVVRGPSQWRRAMFGWKLTEPELVQEVPLSYALAYGGKAPGAEEDSFEFYENNPAGLGFATPQLLAGDAPFEAPQIGELAEFMAADVTVPMTVHGLGPIAKPWLPRRAFAGTFDETWERTRHPRMPADYDLRFWNAAPAPLQFDPPLTGTEAIHLTGLSHALAPLVVQLPRVGLVLQPAGPEGEAEPTTLTLDTVSIDVSDPDPEAHCLDMVWRGIVRQPGRFDRAEIDGIRLEE